MGLDQTVGVFYAQPPLCIGENLFFECRIVIRTMPWTHISFLLFLLLPILKCAQILRVFFHFTSNFSIFKKLIIISFSGEENQV